MEFESLAVGKVGLPPLPRLTNINLQKHQHQDLLTRRTLRY
jgi:hypothetical protein